MKNSSWEGNLRELRNAINYALISAGDLQTLTLAHLPPDLTEGASRTSPTPDALTRELENWLEFVLPEEGPQPDYKALIGSLETQLLKLLLDRYAGKQSHLASALNMNRSTLRKKLHTGKVISGDS